MQTIKLLCGLFMFFALNACKVNKQVQKNTSHTDSTATSTTTSKQATELYQQYQNKRLNNSHTNGQSAYKRQTISYQFKPDSSAKGLQSRLTGITVTDEQGTQATQTANLTRETKEGVSMAKDTAASEEKKNTVMSKTQQTQEKTIRKTGLLSPWLVILIALILTGLLIAWKGKVIWLFLKGIIVTFRKITTNILL